MLSIISSTIYSLDFFKTPITFLISGKEKQSSWLGFFLSLCIIGMLINNIVNSDCYLRTNPTISSQTTTTEPRPFIYFGQDNFSLFVTVRDQAGVTYNDPTIFKIQSIKLGVEVKSLKILQYDINEMNKCDNSSFKDSNKTLSDLSAINAYCLQNSTFKIGGYLDQEINYKLSVDIMRCVNSSKFNNCKTNEEITKFFEQKVVNIYVEGRNFDLNDLNTPVRKIYTTHFVNADNKLYKVINFFMRKVELISDEYYFDSEIKKNISYEMTKENSDMSYIEKSTKILSFRFFTSLEKQQLIRKYQKLTQLFSQLGGLANILMLFGYFIIIIYRRYNLQHLIVSSLYYFQPLNKQKIKSSKIDFLLEFSKINNSQILVSKSNSPKSTHNICISNNEETQTNQKSNFFNVTNSKNIIEIVNNNNLEVSNEISHSKISNTTLLEEGFKDYNEDSKFDPNKIENIKADVLIIPENESQKNIKLNKEKNLSHFKKDITINVNKKKISNNKIIPKTKKKISFSKKQKSALEKLVENDEYKRLDFNFWDYIKYSFKLCFNIKKNDHQTLFEKSKEIFLKEFDLIGVMKRLKEVERLKSILFNQDQVYLFNLLEKEMVFIEEKKQYKEISVDTIKNAVENVMKLDDPFQINKRLIETTNERIKEFNEYINK